MWIGGLRIKCSSQKLRFGSSSPVEAAGFLQELRSSEQKLSDRDFKTRIFNFGSALKTSTSKN